MTTTALFAEMLVGGVEALIWVALIAISIARPSNADAKAILALKDWATPVTPVLLGVAYALGIVVDRVADSLFKVLGMAARAEQRLEVLARGDKVTEFLEYIRSRIRVARVTTLNLFLITIFAGVALKRCTVASTWQIVWTVATLAVLTLGALFATLRIGRTYEKRLGQAVALPAPERNA